MSLNNGYLFICLTGYYNDSDICRYKSSWICNYHMVLDMVVDGYDEAGWLKNSHITTPQVIMNVGGDSQVDFCFMLIGDNDNW